MFRFIASLFGKEYTSCEVCVALREQLEYERSINKELTETLTSLLKPVPVIQPTEAPKPIMPRGQIWSRRRAELERADKEQAALMQRTNLSAKPDKEKVETPQELPKSPVEVKRTKSVEELERELGVVDENGVIQ